MSNASKVLILLLLGVAVTIAWWLHISNKVIPYSTKVHACAPALVQQMQTVIAGTVEGYRVLLKSPKEPPDPREAAAKRLEEYANRVGISGTGDDKYARTLVEPLVQGTLEEQWRGYKKGLQELTKPYIDQKPRELLAKNACFWNCAKGSLDYLTAFENELRQLPGSIQKVSQPFIALSEQSGRAASATYYQEALGRGPLTLAEVKELDAQLTQLRGKEYSLEDKKQANANRRDFVSARMDLLYDARNNNPSDAEMNRIARELEELGREADALDAAYREDDVLLDTVPNTQNEAQVKFAAYIAAETVKALQGAMQKELAWIQTTRSALVGTSAKVRAVCAANAQKGILPPPDSAAFLPQVLQK